MVQKVQNSVYVNIECSLIENLLSLSGALSLESMKIQSHYFNLTSSHKRDTSNFKTIFIYYYIGLSFEVDNSFLGQLV